MAALISSACTPAETPAPAAEPTEPPTAVPTTPPEPTEAPTEVPPTAEPEPTEAPTPAETSEEDMRSKTLVAASHFTTFSSPDIQNPYVPGCNEQTGLHQAAIESLFYLNYESGELIPWLAEDYEMNADSTEVTLYLRDGVKWSDGEPFTADDVVFTLELLRDTPDLVKKAPDMRQSVAEVEAVDDLTVKIELTGSHPTFISDHFGVRISYGVYILPQHIWEGQDPATFKNFDLDKGWPVFTGPYKLTKATQTEFVWERRDDWWGAETGFHALPAPERLVWLALGSEDLRAQGMLADDIDVCSEMSMGTFETVKNQKPEIVAWTTDRPYGWVDPCPHYLILNTVSAPWDEPAMRRALAYAFDKERYVRVKSEGAGSPARWLFPSYAALDAFLDENQDLLDQYDFDLDKAIETIEAQGYTMGSDGFYVSPEGDRLELDIMLLNPDIWPPAAIAGTAYTDIFGDAGIAVDVRFVDWGAWGDSFTSGDFNMAMHWSCGSVVHPHRTLDNWHMRYVEPIGESSDSNWGRWSNAEFSDLADQTKPLTQDDPELSALFREALAIWLEEAPGIPMEQQPRVVPQSNVYWTNWPTADNNYFMPVNWWQSFLMVLMELEPAD
jgi:peptide/nickel transport system substrate-binding protein